MIDQDSDETMFKPQSTMIMKNRISFSRSYEVSYSSSFRSLFASCLLLVLSCRMQDAEGEGEGKEVSFAIVMFLFSEIAPFLTI